jgi:hypothetical protein
MSSSNKTPGPAPLLRDIVLVLVVALEMARRTLETLRILVTVRPKPLITAEKVELAPPFWRAISRIRRESRNRREPMAGPDF